MGDIKINMSGSTGLDQTIDYTAKVALPAGSAGGILESVNVGIGGTFTSPKITLGVKEAAEQAVKNVIDQQIQKLTGSESLGEEIQKQADNLRKEAKRAGDKLVEAAEAQRTKLVDGAKEKGALAKLAAEKAGDKLVEEAKKQASKLSAEAENRSKNSRRSRSRECLFFSPSFSEESSRGACCKAGASRSSPG